MDNRQGSSTKISFISFIFPCLRPQPLEEKPNEVKLLDERSVRIFTLDELNEATSNFSSSCQIGQGGCGIVYKGVLKDGTSVAIKREKKTTYSSTQFMSEVDMLSKTDHLNLVRLIGYTNLDKEHILVTEYVPNGNLRDHLDGKFGEALSLARRLDISIDIAHALTYLHFYADQPIIHRDVKSPNILLTNTLRAKVADFGFSKLGPLDLDMTNVVTQIKGTAGYMDPLYLHTLTLSRKSDVYSFGILLLEIVTGKRPIETERGTEKITVRWVLNMQREGRIAETVDSYIERNPAVDITVESLVTLALECIAPKREDRPNMDRVAEVLSSIRKEYYDLAAQPIPLETHSSTSVSTLSS